ncbi:hypothetical protein Q5P01_015078 [Channa striata]|uniref:Transcription factor BTF3 n=1 Tax=Channa striata TaxID=64152 RepID=A0AA88MH83_CHASR|nr:hypothetical protein Q5P01_015078 [Channa striata]
MLLPLRLCQNFIVHGLVLSVSGKISTSSCHFRASLLSPSFYRLCGPRVYTLQMKESIMNQEKLAKLQAQVRIGGKGSARRKKKVVHRTATADDKKLQFSLKKLGVNNISGIEEVNMFTNQGTVIHFNNPKVQASLAANTFTITGHAENKQLTEMLPGILNQLGADSLTSLRRLAETLPKPVSDNKAPMVAAEEEDDEVPDLVENFDEASKNEAD